MVAIDRGQVSHGFRVLVLGVLLVAGVVEKSVKASPTAKNPPRGSSKVRTRVHPLIHIDVKYLLQVPDEKQRCYLFVAIDRLGSENAHCASAHPTLPSANQRDGGAGFSES